MPSLVNLAKLFFKKIIIAPSYCDINSLIAQLEYQITPSDASSLCAFGLPSPDAPTSHGLPFPSLAIFIGNAFGDSRLCRLTAHRSVAAGDWEVDAIEVAICLHVFPPF